MKKVIGYCRVSTRRQGKSGLGLEAQHESITRYCEREGYEIVRIDNEVASGKLDESQRPILAQAMEDSIKLGYTILTAKLCRLSRDTLVIKLLTRKSKAVFEDVELGFDPDPLFMGMSSEFNERERMKISERTKAALGAKRARGEPLGNMANLEAGAEKGRQVLRDRAMVAIEGHRKALRRVVGMTLADAARELNESMVLTPNKGKWHPMQVSRAMTRLGLA